MKDEGAPRWRRTAPRARPRTGRALLLVLSLGGIGVTLSPAGTQVGRALQAWQGWSSGALGPVVTVTELRQDVARDPGRWLGHTVVVRGRLDDVLGPLCPGDPVCMGHPTLEDAAPGPAGAVGRLPLEWGGPDPLSAALQHLPLLGRLVPPLHAPRWGAVATYRVRLDLAPGASCGRAVCYTAMLLDVAQRDMCYPRHREHPPRPCTEP